MNFSLKRSFVLVLLIQYIAHYRVSKVIRKHTKLNHNHPNTPFQKFVGNKGYNLSLESKR